MRSLVVPGCLLLIGFASSAPAEEQVDAPYRITVDLTDEIRSLANEDSFAREPAEELLAALDDKAVAPLAAALDREDAATRLGIVEVLESIEGSRVTSVLLERAKADPSVDVQSAAIAALILRVDPEAGEVVPGALASDDPRLYRVAFDGCARYCTEPEQLDRIVDFSFTEPVMLFGAGPRGALFRAAAAPSRRPAVVAAVERRAAARLEDADPETRVRAGLLFADLEDPRAATALTAALGSDGEPLLLLQALVALGKIGGTPEAEAIARGLPTLPPALQAGGCKALGRMAGRDVVGAAEQARAAGCDKTKGAPEPSPVRP